MGREIRRVPLDFVHPPMVIDNTPFEINGVMYQIKPQFLAQIQPMRDMTFAQALTEWNVEKEAWESDDNREYRERKYKEYGISTFEEWHGKPPSDARYYRPEWPSDTVLGYCLYETVSEGTPLSPVFETPEELANWLLEDQGYTDTAVREFLLVGSAPTMAVVNGTLVSNLEIYDCDTVNIDDR
jgi:hypothetical protein